MLFQDNSSVPHVATGVEFAQSDGTGSRMTAFARKEVILSAGTIQVRHACNTHRPQAIPGTDHRSQTPALLQLSGIGDSAILEPLNITTLIDLKTVGRNLQEQTQSMIGGTSSGFDVGGLGPRDALGFPNIHELFGDSANASIAKIEGSLDAWAESQAHNALSAEALRTIYGIQARVIVNDSGE